MNKVKVKVKVFKSKVGFWYYFTIALVALIGLLLFLRGQQIAAALTLPTLLWMLHILRTTRYEITADDNLLVRCSIFPTKQIPIARIEALERSLYPLPSYALSINRIIIWSDQKIWMLLSPQDEATFIHTLRNINPNIIIISQ